MTALLTSFSLFVSYVTATADYYYVNKLSTWSDARMYCQDQCDSDLVSIHSELDFNNTISSIPSSNILYESSYIWIGLSYSNPSFVWTDQTSLDYNNWHFMNTSDNKHCVRMILHQYYKWETAQCANNNTFICSSCDYKNANNTPSYHVNPNILSWNKSQSYCMNHCNSNLASIHNERDNKYAKYLSMKGYKLNINGYSNNVSIGLNDWISGNNKEWQWIDGSIVDYGDNAAYIGTWRLYPWSGRLEGNDAKCVRMKAHLNYEFDDGNCSDIATSRFMCNSCDAVLNKYIVVNINKTHSDANTYCRDVLKTSLASIHSISDYNEAKYLCELNINGDCHIGLDCIGASCFYQYDDTQFDFGNDLTKYPWSADYNGPEVVLSKNDGYLYKAIDLNEQHPFLCNMPSTLCDAEEWTEFGGNGWTFDTTKNTGNCNVRYGNNGAVVMTNKQFVNENGELLIELIYSTTNIIDSEWNSGGIMLFNMERVCDYYYISITAGSNSKLSLAKVVNGIYYVLAINDTMQFNLDTTTNRIAFVLRVRVIDGDIFKVYINDNLMIQYMDITSNVNGGVLSGYIGIMNQNLDIIFRSLHISGSEWIYDSISLNMCNISQFNTLSPTNKPTITPSLQPTYIPTISPTKYPTINPSLSPTYHPTIKPTKYPTISPTERPSNEPTVEPTNYPTLEPIQEPIQSTTEKPTEQPIEFESGSVDDDDISTTMLLKTKDEDLKDDFFWDIMYIMVAVIICCIGGTFIVIMYINKRKQNRKYAQKGLELEQIKPDPILITPGFHEKRQLTADDSAEQLYGENNNDITDDILIVGDTPNTTTGGGDDDDNDINYNINILNQSISNDDNDIDEMFNNKPNEINNILPTMGNTTEGLQSNITTKNINDEEEEEEEIINDNNSDSDDMYCHQGENEKNNKITNKNNHTTN